MESDDKKVVRLVQSDDALIEDANITHERINRETRRTAFPAGNGGCMWEF